MKELSKEDVEELREFASRMQGIDFVNLADIGFSSESASDIIGQFAKLSKFVALGIDGRSLRCFAILAKLIRKYQMLPISFTEDCITMAMVNPQDVFAIDDIKVLTGMKVKPVLVDEGQLKSCVEMFYNGTDVEWGRSIKSV